MNKEEIDILYSFANDEDCRDVYDWQGFNYEEICPLVDKLIKEDKKYKEVIDKINNYIDNYDIFKVFSFPLMKRWEEEQVKSSINYEFKTSLIKDLKDILKEVE